MCIDNSRLKKVGFIIILAVVLGCFAGIPSAFATTPTITDVTSFATDKAYKTGDIIPITVSFSENVFVTGTPQ